MEVVRVPLGAWGRALRAAFPLRRKAGGRSAVSEEAFRLPMASDLAAPNRGPTHKKVQRLRTAVQTAALDPAGGEAYAASLGPAGGEVPLKFMAWEANLYAFLALFAVGAPAFTLLFGLQMVMFFFVLGAILVTPRFYCRYFCRTGALISLTSKYALLQVRKRQSTCDHTQACLKTCPMGKGQDTYIPGVNDEVQERLRDTLNCVHCYRCVTACPTPTLQVRFGELPVLVPKPWRKEAARAAAASGSGTPPEARP